MGFKLLKKGLLLKIQKELLERQLERNKIESKPSKLREEIECLREQERTLKRERRKTQKQLGDQKKLLKKRPPVDEDTLLQRKELLLKEDKKLLEESKSLNEKGFHKEKEFQMIPKTGSVWEVIKDRETSKNGGLLKNKIPKEGGLSQGGNFLNEWELLETNDQLKHFRLPEIYALPSIVERINVNERKRAANKQKLLNLNRKMEALRLKPLKPHPSKQEIKERVEAIKKELEKKVLLQKSW